MSKTCCKRCGANEDRINGFCSVECEEYYRLEEEINTLDNVILERGAEIGRLTARIAELEAAQRWIPVSERLPEEDTDGNTLMVICRHSGEWVRAPFGAEFADEFVRHYSYWMYAPQPPEGKFDQLTARWRQERQDDKWIPVSERLPEDGEVVWLWDGNNMGMGYYLIFSGCFMDRDTPLRQIKPTHWMPLPEPPNDTQTETFVYGKDSKPIPRPFCGKLPYDDVLF